MTTEELQRQIRSVIERLPQRDKINRVRLFGSTIRGEDNDTSDIDLLVEFQEDVAVGYFELVRVQQFLEKNLGRRVDVVTPRALSRHFRDDVLREARSVYG